MIGSWSSDTISAGSRDDWRSHLAGIIKPTSYAVDLHPIIDKLVMGESLSVDDGMFLFQYEDLDAIGRLANEVKKSRFDSNVFFNNNVHINQTNMCVLACKFCAFRRGRNASDAYALEIEDYLETLDKFSPYVDEVHSVGGLHPEWTIEHYEGLFKSIRKNHSHIHVKALTAVEIKHLAEISNLSVENTLDRLKRAGLGSLPGGGAEILDDKIRENICNGKESSSEYIEIHRTAHNIKIPTNCTMLFGTIETVEDRVKHMIKLRDLQNETLGFQCFVPYPFLPDDTRLPEATLSTGVETLRVIAISRLIIDNIPHIKAYRMNIGDGLAELALNFGADDLDGTVQQESIMHLAGSKASLDFDRENLARLIADAGCRPVQRNSIYTKFSDYESPTKNTTIHLQMAR